MCWIDDINLLLTYHGRRIVIVTSSVGISLRLQSDDGLCSKCGKIGHWGLHWRKQWIIWIAIITVQRDRMYRRVQPLNLLSKMYSFNEKIGDFDLKNNQWPKSKHQKKIKPLFTHHSPHYLPHSCAFYTLNCSHSSMIAWNFSSTSRSGKKNVQLVSVVAVAATVVCRYHVVFVHNGASRRHESRDVLYNHHCTNRRRRCACV